MKKLNYILIIRQLDKKLQAFKPLQEAGIPTGGWVRAIRLTLNMSLNYVGKRLSITPQGVKDIERRESDNTITLKAMQEVANALDMSFVYGLIPKNGSLEEMIDRKANALAKKIVNRTSTTMKLEDQENSKERLEQAITDLTEELKREIPKSLWE
jgi:predicted DNA-binding mobile mystery protein A